MLALEETLELKSVTLVLSAQENREPKLLNNFLKFTDG